MIVVTIIAFFAMVTIPGTLSFLAAYHRNSAARQVLADLRKAQSVAVVRGGIYALQWGGAVGRSASEYRLIRDTTGACGLPATTAARDDTDIIESWTDLNQTFSGMRIVSVKDNGGADMGTVMFDSRGASVQKCSAASFPVRVILSDKNGHQKQIEIKSAGSVRLL